MKKSTEQRPSRLVPQRPVRKTRLLPRGRSQNSYRRNRFKGESRKSWLRGVAWVFGLLTLAGLCLGLVVLYHQLLTCSAFCIKDINNIEIEGTKRLSPSVLLQQARLGPGVNLLAIRPGQVERALMTHPWIAKAEVSRKWPHSLHLKIQERDPVALAQIGEELLYMDRQGMIFKPLSPGDPHNFPVITGLTPEQFRHGAGDLPEVVAQAFNLMEVLKKMPPPLNLENISEIHADLEQGFTLYANGVGVALDVGFKDYSEKLQKFAQLWPVLVQKGLVAKTGRINLNYPRRALVTLKGMEANP
ncbi:MAG: FtsQ-type POTRA domain-containing protein [Desulfobaccales bacterium]